MAANYQQNESRHLWVGNIPDHFDEDDIRMYFEKKFGQIEKVKLLPKKTAQGGGVAAFIDFVDLRSAMKAHNCQVVIQGREVRMNYNDPKLGRPQQAQQPPHQHQPAQPAPHAHPYHQPQYPNRRMRISPEMQMHQPQQSRKNIPQRE